MSATEALTLALIVPLSAAVVLPFLGRWPDLRETVTLIAAVGLFIAVVSLYMAFRDGDVAELNVLTVVPGLEFAFRVEPLGMLFGLVAATLWIANSVYSIGYMRANNEPRQTTFYTCFAIALASTMGLAFAKNLFTLFLCYEALTLSTYPLVTHKATDEAVAAGRVYLLLLIGTSMVLLLPAIAWTWAIAGTTEFRPGGILPATTNPTTLTILVALFAFGIGKAALMPFHFWLPSAMVAPTPVSALLHAVAVVKAGVFTVTKVMVYVFGVETLAKTGSSEWLVYFTSFCLLTASIIALTKTNLKARLAYSTVSQLAYVVLGAAIASKLAVIGSGVHIAMHAAGKITLFFCAGAIYTAAHKTEIHELDGIGRIMPVTMLAFLIGSLSIIGLPPLGGTWGKWFLALGALDRGYVFVVAVLMISSLLNVAYLLSIVGRAFFLPPPGKTHGDRVQIHEAPLACVVPLSLTAIGCIILFFFAGEVQGLVALAF